MLILLTTNIWSRLAAELRGRCLHFKVTSFGSQLSGSEFVKYISFEAFHHHSPVTDDQDQQLGYGLANYRYSRLDPNLNSLQFTLDYQACKRDRCFNTYVHKLHPLQLWPGCQKYFIMSKILEIRWCLPCQINRGEWGDGRSRLREGRAFCIGGRGALSLHAVDTVTPDTSLLLVRKGGEGVNWAGDGEGHPHGKWSTARSCPRLEKR